MSASLVGSEMCIRDRFGHAGSPFHGAGPSRTPTWIELLGASLALVSAPVSYTHLTLPTICSV
eukprot:11771746-Alexandrium_andersonii.AAC.1